MSFQVLQLCSFDGADILEGDLLGDGDHRLFNEILECSSHSDSAINEQFRSMILISGDFRRG
jgi:hypothetical protein